MSNLVYEDNPWKKLPQLSRYRGERHEQPFQIIMLLVGLPIIVSSVVFIIGFHKVVIISVIAVIVLISIIGALALTPNKYQIFNDRIRVVRQGMPALDILFSNIESIEKTTWVRTWGLNFNMINSTNSDHILRITRKRGAKVHITPSDRPLFIEHLNKAMDEWRNIPTAIAV